MDCKNITTACRGSRQAAAGGLSTQIFQGLKQRAKLAWEWNEQHGLSHGNGTNGMAGVKLSNHHSLWRSLFMFFPSFLILYRKVQVWSKKWLTLVNQSTTPKLPELFLALINSQTLRTRLAQWPVWCLSQVKDTAEIYQQGLAKWKAYELL